MSRTLHAAALAALALLSPVPAAAEGGLRQSVSIDAAQEAWYGGPREDGPVNAGNWMDLPAWHLGLLSDAELRVEADRAFSLSISPRVSWQELEGSASSLARSARDGSTKEAEIELRRAEASLELPELGIRALFGKMRPEFGVDFIEPFSVINRRGKAEFDEGLWMGGLNLAWRDLSLEAYCEAKADPVALAALSALAGEHELGLLYRYEGGNDIGTWYRGQIGNELIPYAEAMLRDEAAALDVEGLSPRAEAWNWDALLGLGYTPAWANVSAYLEYRYRSGGYGDEDWKSLRATVDAAGRGAEAALLSGLPRLQTSVHGLALYLRDAREIAERYSWSAFAAYLHPGGLYASLGASARIAAQCSLEAESDLAASLGDGSPSELAYWPYSWRCSLRLRWKIKAEE
jgi:hypothetical protein